MIFLKQCAGAQHLGVLWAPVHRCIAAVGHLKTSASAPGPLAMQLASLWHNTARHPFAADQSHPEHPFSEEHGHPHKQAQLMLQCSPCPWLLNGPAHVSLLLYRPGCPLSTQQRGGHAFGGVVKPGLAFPCEVRCCSSLTNEANSICRQAGC